MNKPHIILAADHAGFTLKEKVKSHLQKGGYEVLDVGAHELVETDDYPVYMAQAGLKVAEDMDGNTKAIIFGSTGQGEAMVANRFPGVRATVWYGSAHKPFVDASGNSLDIIQSSREHNNANILSIGARMVDEESAIEAIDMWLTIPFNGDERHARRNELIDNIE